MLIWSLCRERASYEESMRIADEILDSLSAVRSPPTFTEPAPQHRLFGARDFLQNAPTQAPADSTWPNHQPTPQHQRRPIPPASHSEDWLDQNQAAITNPFDYYIRANSLLFPTDVRPESTSSSTSEDESSPFVALPDSSPEPDDPVEADQVDMPPAGQNHRRTSLVDLTQGSTVSPEAVSSRPTPLKRNAGESGSGEGAAKRARLTTEGIEEIDLANEAPSADEELLQAQQQEAIRAQQAVDENGPQRIGKRQCIICMENYTNCTATVCGKSRQWQMRFERAVTDAFQDISIAMSA